jgi:hypothetical protein
MRWDDLFPFLAAAPPGRFPWAASEPLEPDPAERASDVARALLELPDQSFAIESLAPGFAWIDGPLSDLLDHETGQVLARHRIVLRSDLAPLSFGALADLDAVGPARLRAVARGVVGGTLERRAAAGWLESPGSPARGPRSERPRAPTAALEPYAAAAAGLLARLSDRQRRVFAARHLAAEPSTLSRLGADLGVSRERVRQILVEARERIETALEAPELALVRHDAQALHAALGSAFPDGAPELEDEIATLLGTREDELVRLALYVAGPYRLVDGWWVADPGLSPAAPLAPGASVSAPPLVHRRFRDRWLAARAGLTPSGEG